MAQTASIQIHTQAVESPVTAVALLDRINLLRLDMSVKIAADQSRQAKLGQFFTPESVARFMASLFVFPQIPKTLRLLDAGGGNGMLTAAAVAELCTRRTARPECIIATVWELDTNLIQSLEETLRLCEVACRDEGVRFVADLRHGNFILDAADMLGGNRLFAGHIPRFDAAILNPPYRKLRSDSEERLRLRSAGIETSNIYAAFVWLATELLADKGELVAITPRSYMNGSYFRLFRQALLSRMAFRRIHVYDSRRAAFNQDDVLQENAIIHAVRGGDPTPIVVTTSQGPDDEGMASQTLALEQFVLPHDRDAVMYVVPDETDAQIGLAMRRLPYTLAELNIAVSTGRVVEFRARDRLRAKASKGDVPLIFPRHLSPEGYVEWPRETGDKPNAIQVRGQDDPDLFPHGWYVLVKRFSAKEEKRRIVAALCDPSRLPRGPVGFDNKLNVLHQNNRGLPPELARGLAMFLNGTAVDAYFRQFSGHTQVNARDIRSLRFPDRETLERLGRRMTGKMPPTDEINQLIREEIPFMHEGDDPIANKTKIESALDVLKALKAPKGQINDRSALTLLALLDLDPSTPWSKAGDPPRGVTELMGWIATKYGKKYAPNTRETIRRFTLHQFVEMGFVSLNPDDPQRPTNSPKNVYRVESSALELLRTFGTDDWQDNLTEYLDSLGRTNRLREAARQMAQIPITLPTGKTLHLSAGGQNVLIKEIIEQFAPRFTPGGHVVYIGDASEKHLVYDESYLQQLGVAVNRHGKMPDVVIHYKERDWLVLVEAVTSHGPVNMLRHTQLKDLFADSTAGLVFVTAFLDRRAMREYLPDIAWETEVWVADTPDHLIHFNGERFLGPYR